MLLPRRVLRVYPAGITQRTVCAAPPLPCLGLHCVVLPWLCLPWPALLRTCMFCSSARTSRMHMLIRVLNCLRSSVNTLFSCMNQQHTFSELLVLLCSCSWPLGPCLSHEPLSCCLAYTFPVSFFLLPGQRKSCVIKQDTSITLPAVNSTVRYPHEHHLLIANICRGVGLSLPVELGGHIPSFDAYDIQTGGAIPCALKDSSRWGSENVYCLI